MVDTTTVLAAMGALALSEATGTTNVTPIQPATGDQDGGGGGGAPGLQRPTGGGTSAEELAAIASATQGGGGGTTINVAQPATSVPTGESLREALEDATEGLGGDGSDGDGSGGPSLPGDVSPPSSEDVDRWIDRARETGEDVATGADGDGFDLQDLEGRGGGLGTAVATIGEAGVAVGEAGDALGDTVEDVGGGLNAVIDSQVTETPSGTPVLSAPYAAGGATGEAAREVADAGRDVATGARDRLEETVGGVADAVGGLF